MVERESRPDVGELERARERIRPYLNRTPLWHSSTLSRMTGHEVYVKAELFQRTGSYKPRGMLNRLLLTSPEERRRGVITFSSGNAAQGLAYAASVLDIRATVVMPCKASTVKAEATRGYGADVVLHGTVHEAYELCREIERKDGLLYVHPYDDLEVMAGHASVAFEILDDVSEPFAIYVPVGGGGMAGGVALGLIARRSSARLYGAEPKGAPKMFQSLNAGHPVVLEDPRTIADGLAAPTAGAHCFPLIRERVEEIVLVEDADIVEAMKLLMIRLKLYVEPAGAAALAAYLATASRHPSGSKIVCLVSGGNIDLPRLLELIE